MELVVFLFYAKGSAGEVRSMVWNAEDIGYVSPAAAEELRGRVRQVSSQLQLWFASMQAPDFNLGPKHHHAPAAGLRRWEAHLAQLGLVRLPDGRYAETAPRCGPETCGGLDGSDAADG